MRLGIAVVMTILTLALGHERMLAQIRAGDVPVLESIRMLNVVTGWAVAHGQGGNTLLRTIDGGAHWKDVTPLDASGRKITVDPYSFEALTSLIAWVGSFRTVDGGRTWKDATVPAQAWVESINFINARDGWVLSLQGANMATAELDVYRSTDGGETWSRVADARNGATESSGFPFIGAKLDVTFVNSTTGWITGGNGMDRDWMLLYVTQDAGRSWQPQNLSLPPQIAPHWSGWAEPPIFFTAREGILPVSYSILNESFESIARVVVFYMTRDGGTRWTYSTPVSVTRMGPPSSFADVNHGWISDGAALYATIDGGRLWTKVEPTPLIAEVKQLDFISPQVGWAVRSYALQSGIHQAPPFLLRTLDGGRTWVSMTYTISQR